MNQMLLPDLHGGIRSEHRRAWSSVLVVGCILVAAFNVFGSVKGWGQLIPAGLLCGLMGLYVVIVRDKKEISDDVKGDSIYYLGLLFSFAALTATLAKFTGLEEGSDADLADLLSNFGIALWTTVVGLSGRAWFALGRESVGDMASDAAQALEDAASKMKIQAVRSGHILESLVDHLEMSESIWKQTVSRLSESAGQVDLAAGFHDQIGRISGIAEDLARSVATVTEASDGIAASASRLNGPMTDAADRMVQLGSDCNRLAGAMNRAHLSVSALDVTEFSEGLSGLGVSAAEGARQMDSLKESLDVTGRGLADFGVQAAGGSKALEGVANAGVHISSLSSEMAILASALGRLQPTVKRIVDAASALDVREISEGLSGLGASVKEGARQMDSLQESLDVTGRGLADFGVQAAGGSKALEGVANAGVHISSLSSEMATLASALGRLQPTVRRIVDAASALDVGEISERFSGLGASAAEGARQMNSFQESLDVTGRGLVDFGIQAAGGSKALEGVTKAGAHISVLNSEMAILALALGRLQPTVERIIDAADDVARGVRHAGQTVDRAGSDIEGSADPIRRVAEKLSGFPAQVARLRDKAREASDGLAAAEQASQELRATLAEAQASVPFFPVAVYWSRFVGRLKRLFARVRRNKRSDSPPP